MIQLLQRFSLTDILIFIVMFALIFKNSLSFLEWFTKTGINFFKQKYQKPKELEQTVKDLILSIKGLTEKVDLLMESDKDAIKAFITRQHHYFVYQKGWIDDYSLECIEKRFKHYIEEGGNSFVQDLMEDLRTIPKQPPEP